MKLLLQYFFFFISLVCLSQQTDYVDFKTAKADLVVKPNEGQIGGHIVYTFEVLKDVDSIFLDAQNFTHIEALYDEKVYHDYNGKYIVVKHPFKKGEKNQIDIGFTTNPKKALYFIGWDSNGGFESASASSVHSLNHQNGQVWTQGQGKYTSNWLPSIDDMNDKIEFDISVVFDKGYEVIANGKLTKTEDYYGKTKWHYDMQQPMSSYLVALAIGKYDKKVEYSKSGIPLEMYYYPEDSLKFEPTYRYTKRMFDFLEEEIGVPYPWQNYKQVPVKDFLYAGMENTGTTIFSDSFVIDSIAFVDKNYVNVNAHELAHQWFGDLVTETSGTHHWLQEGFATYYALLAEKDIFGDDYYYWRLYEYAQELFEQDKAGQSTSLLDPKSSSVTFYKKGAWVLHLLREQVGYKAFRKGVKKYLLKYQFKNVKTDDFIKEIEKSSGQDLRNFVEKWLKSSELHYEELEKRFFPNKVFIQDMHGQLNPLGLTRYFPLDCDNQPEACKIIFLQSDDSFLNEKIVEQLGNNISKATFSKGDVKVRRAIAKAMTEIPKELKEDYESLLTDKSYLTIEAALYNLWTNFPEDRIRYLNQIKGIVGFNDKNIRTLWLALALVTSDFEPENKQRYFEELRGYTNPKYHFEVRQNAFQYLNSIKACDRVCKENLEQAAKHHVWQFSKFAKQLLKEID
ncbi:M1 family metallopeptidase [Aestuariivivens insulae]|uniref:M1 family metallopeptidase n=1 Tax=Aestuariivivens insulae TaxID=1621988 RepID=UPI001F5A0FD7|nr:M1 family metallopeptidase [Aestuariivivens insulae]